MKCNICGSRENLFIVKNQYGTTTKDICCECRNKKIKENLYNNVNKNDRFVSFLLTQLKKNELELDNRLNDLSKQEIFIKLCDDTINLNVYEKVSLSERYYSFVNNLNDRPKCNVCDNKVKFISILDGYKKCCSVKCTNNDKKRSEKTRQTNLEKYGVDSTNKLDSKKQKTRQTNLEKYGVEHYSKTDEFTDKTKEAWKNKTEEEVEKITKKTKKTKKELFNDENYNNRDKAKETCLEKYGVEHTSKREEFGNNFRETCLEKYNSKHYLSSNQYKILQRERYWDIFIKNLKDKNIIPLFDKDDYININIEERFYLCSKCNKKFNTTQLNTQKIHCQCHRSSYEVDIETFIKTLQIEKIDLNKKFNLKNENQRNFEIDIFIPDYNLGIEFHGLYWHSDLFKDKKYHYNKYKWCKEKNIHLIQIFENEWTNKREIVKSIIKSKLKMNKSVYARKCQTKEIDNNTYNEFLENNHIQGKVNASIKYGLFHNNELLSVISFGKCRYNNKMELLRFCNKREINVIGGFSKLFKYVIRKYSFEKIITYSDLRYFNGDVYKYAGFKYSHITPSNYYYFKNKENILYNRMKFQKHKLKNILEKYDGNKTEYENMINNDYLRIYDAGNNCYIWEDH